MFCNHFKNNPIDACPIQHRNLQNELIGQRPYNGAAPFKSEEGDVCP